VSFFCNCWVDRPRRFAVIREQLAPSEPRWERNCSMFPATPSRFRHQNFALPAGTDLADYNRRGDMEIAIAELKHDLAADDFVCGSSRHEAAFRSILLLFNLLGEFQRAAASPAIASPPHCAPRFSFAAALLGRAGHRLVLHLSTSWAACSSASTAGKTS